MNALAFVLQVLTALPSLIQTAEVAFSGKPGSGKFKKQFVMDTVNAALVIAPTAGAKITPEQQEAVSATSSALVDSVVANINAFNKSATDPQVK
jgi:hypothetical protein